MLIQQKKNGNIFLISTRIKDSILHANYLQWRQLAWNVKYCFLGRILPRVLSVNIHNRVKILIILHCQGCKVSSCGQRRLIRLCGCICPKMCFLTLWLVTPLQKTRQFKYIENFTATNWKFSDKNSYIFHISAQNIDCGYSLEPPRRGGSNEYPQSMFLSRNKKNNVYPCKHQFYYIIESVDFSAGRAISDIVPDRRKLV